ncbi:MAG: glycosyltransferase family 4 protein [Pirellulales bacterium]|nr:glycosyltransferase family 4 protein [Pirellulales bacterium]
MPKKPTVAVFASTLMQHNPRGALRLFRALADELARRDEFECLVLHERIAGQTYPLFPVSTLSAWLAANPLAAARREPREELASWQVTLATFLRKSRTAAWLALRAGASLLPAVLRQMLKNLWKLRHDVALALRTTAPGPIPYDRVASLAEIDVLLNFWWFHAPVNPLESCAIPPNLKVVSWFLDAIPLRVGHCDPLGFVNVDGFLRAVMNHLRMADEVVAISPSAADDAHHFFGVPRKRIAIIPCGVSPPLVAAADSWDDLRRRLKLAPDLPIVVCLGLEEPSKNILNVLRACRLRASERNPAFQLVLVGEVRNHSMRQRQEYLAARLRQYIPVSFTGYLCDQDVQSLLRASEVLLYPSLWEGFGMPPLEALQAGAQVVTSEIGPMPWICDRFAHYCDPFDPRDIARALDEALLLPAAERAEQQIAAAEHIAEFSWGAAGDQLAALITRLATTAVDERPSPPRAAVERAPAAGHLAARSHAVAGV